MPLKKSKPITPGSRFATGSDFAELQGEADVKALLRPLDNRAGRGAGGRISVRRRGGRHKRRYRVVDFRRDKRGIPGTVVAVGYDPNRSANLALVCYADGEKRYMLAPRGLTVGRSVISGPKAAVEVGNALPLKDIPLGMAVHNVELALGRGGQLARAAGGRATLVARAGDYVTLRLPSGEVRMVFHECMASITPLLWRVPQQPDTRPAPPFRGSPGVPTAAPSGLPDASPKPPEYVDDGACAPRDYAPAGCAVGPAPARSRSPP